MELDHFYIILLSFCLIYALLFIKNAYLCTIEVNWYVKAEYHHRITIRIQKRFHAERNRS